MRGRETRARAASALVAFGIVACSSDDASGGAAGGRVYARGLSGGDITQLTTDGDYSGRLVHVGAGGRYVFVWVKDLDIWGRRL